MITLLPIISIALLGIYAYLMRPQKIIVAEAGPTVQVTHNYQESKRFNVPYEKIKLDNGETIDTRDFIRVYVDGKCMKSRRIKNGSQVLVEKIKNEEEFEKKVNPNDILLIYLKDKKIYKLRIFEKEKNEKELITYRYMNNSKHPSSKPHKKEDVVGVVKYIID